MMVIITMISIQESQQQKGEDCHKTYTKRSGSAQTAQRSCYDELCLGLRKPTGGIEDDEDDVGCLEGA